MADRARFAARTAEQRETRLQQMSATAQAQIGFRDCRANSSSSPPTEYRGTAEIGFRDSTVDIEATELEFEEDNHTLSVFSQVIEDICQGSASVETLLSCESFDVAFSDQNITLSISH